jgi:hypothetical protein
MLLGAVVFLLVAGFVAEVAAAVQWAVTELQRPPVGTLWHTYTRGLGKDLLGLAGPIYGLQEVLSSEPGYVQLVLPSAQLAWRLLQYEQQAEAASAAGGSGSAGARRNARPSAANQQQQQQQRLQPMQGMPGAMLEFTRAFGMAFYSGLLDKLLPAVDQLCSSDEVMQLLLVFTALSVGAARKRVAADAPKDRYRRSSSSKRSSSRSDTAAAGLAPLAPADVPASHLQLLAALSPPMRKQINRQTRTAQAQEIMEAST